MHNKIMQMKSVLIVSVLCLVITSCASQQGETLPIAQLESTITPYPTYTPVVTATPIYIESDIQDINQIVRAIHKEHPGCRLFNAMNSERDSLKFFAVTNKDVFKKLFVSEIAESLNEEYRAYLALDFNIPLRNCETGCDQSRIYIENLKTGKLQGINWNGYMPKRITSNLIWIGNDILVFQQNINLYNNETVAIDVDQQIIVYRSLESCN